MQIVKKGNFMTFGDLVWGSESPFRIERRRMEPWTLHSIQSLTLHAQGRVCSVTLSQI